MLTLMFIVSEYWLKAGVGESHYCWVFDTEEKARNHFNALVNQTKESMPGIDCDENNAHFEDVVDGDIWLYDCIITEIVPHGYGR